MNKIILIILIVLVVVIIAVFGSNLFKKDIKTTSSLTKASIVLDWFPWSAQAGLWVAKHKGYFKDERIDITFNIPSDPSTVLETVASGRDDFGINYQTNLLLARNQGIKVVSILGIVQHTLNSIMSLKASGITGPLDLVGRKIGTTGVPEYEKVLETVLKSQGKSIKDVELIKVGFDVVPALISKKVDAIIPAYSVYEAVSAENKGFPVNVMRLEQNGIPDYYELLVVANEKTISEDKDLIGRFVRAVRRGYEDAISDPVAAIKIMKKINPEADLNLEIPSVKLLAPLWVPENKIFGWQEEKRWIDYANWMKENGLISKDLDVKDAFDNSFVENAAKK